MPRGKLHRLLGAAALLLAGLPGLTACSGGSSAAGSTPTTSSAASAAATTQPSPSTTADSASCRTGPGRTVVQLPDVEVPAVSAAPVTSPATTVGDTSVPTRTVPGFTIPAQTVDGGCRVTSDAPGGCLGAVQVSSVTIPAETIPARTLPAVSLPDGRSLPAVTMPAITAAAVVVPGVRADQVCRLGSGNTRSSVVRPSIVRRSRARPSVTQAAAAQPGVQVGSSYLPSLSVGPTYLPAVQVDSVITPYGYLAYQVLPADKDVQVAQGKDRTAYLAPGDVLFATDRASLRPSARRVLHAIATRIEAGRRDTTITVEGHTDSRGTPAHNLDLSRRRAQSVSVWLQRKAGVAPSRLTVRGLGETTPIATDATAAGRRSNRRVVISVER